MDLFETKPIRNLSVKQATRCEEAQEEQCKCRCGGAYHGAKRGAVQSFPVGDPHSVKKECPRCAGKGVEKYGGYRYRCSKCQGMGYTMPKGATAMFSDKGIQANPDDRANYKIIKRADDHVLIHDIGPWDKFKTVTNAAEFVVYELLRDGVLKENQRLFYIDSDGNMDEIVVKDGRFAGFKPGPERKVEK